MPVARGMKPSASTRNAAPPPSANPRHSVGSRASLGGPRKGFLKHFCKLFLQNGKIMMKNNKIILFSMFFHYLINIFVFDDFLIIQFFAENQRLIFDEKMDNQKNVKNKK